MQRHHIDCEDDRAPGIRHFVRQKGLKKSLHYRLRLDDASRHPKPFSMSAVRVSFATNQKETLPMTTLEVAVAAIAGEVIRSIFGKKRVSS